MNIKNRILLSVIFLQITGFALVLINHQQRASEGVLGANRQRIADDAANTVRYLDAIAGQFERTAFGLARSSEHFADSHHQHVHQPVELQAVLLNTIRPTPQISLAGVHFSDPDIQGAVVRRDGDNLVMRWVQETPRFAARDMSWQLLNPPDGERAVRVTAHMYDRQQSPSGIVVIDWPAADIIRLLQPQVRTPGSELLLYSHDGHALIASAHADDIWPLLNPSLALPGHQSSRSMATADHLYFINPSRTGLISVIKVPHQDLMDAAQTRLSDDLLISIGIALLFISVMALVLEILFRPFEMILQRMRYAVARNRDAGQPVLQTIHYNEKNEFTPLVHTFNTLVEQVGEFTDRLSHSNALLQQEQQRVADLNTTLEERVEERTRELAAKTAEAQESLQELKLTQQRLVSMEKHEALGEIVAGLAHEINTPLGISVTAVSALDEQLRTLEKQHRHQPPAITDWQDFRDFARESLQITGQNLQRAADMIERFKQVAVDQSSEQRREFDLCDYLHSILMSLRPYYKYRPVDVQIECRSRMFISSYPGALAQIITNLMMNALTHAFPDKEQPGRIHISAWQENGRVHISFGDNGRGMNEQTRQHFFQPFYTTRRNQGGSGLGGYIIQDLVVHQLHGEASIRSTEGHGCEVLLSFPMHSQ